MTLSADDFERIGDDPLELEAGGRRLTARVVEVKRMATDDRPERNDFSVLFRTADADPVPQQIFRLEHPALGEQHLFLVPLGPRGDEFEYEAVFS